MAMTSLASRAHRGPSRLLGVVAAAVLWSSALAAQTKVYPYPGDPSWYPMDRMWNPLGTLDGWAEITGANPRYGNGSLALGTSGDLYDWGFYGTRSGPNSWGRLGDVSGLSFEWYRSDIGYTTPDEPYYSSWPDAPWLAQTPVLRLLLGAEMDGKLVMGELVWEKYYTAPGPYTTPFDQWNAENLFAQNFWFNVGGAQYWVNSQCQPQSAGDPEPEVTPPPVWAGGLLLGTLSGWAGGSFADPNATTACQQQQFSLTDWELYGLAVGVGSNWPDAYRGFADWVRLSVNGQDVVFANFELPETTVPEPGTMILLSTGLLGLSVAGWAQRRRRRLENHTST